MDAADPTRDELRRCVELCRTCHVVCVETSAHCFTIGGTFGDPAHQRTVLNCATLCQTSAELIARGAPAYVRTCALCAEQCVRCADSCAHLGGDDWILNTCVETCRRCAEACRQVARA